MTRPSTFFIVCCVFMSVLLFFSCKKKEDTVETKEIMSGAILHNIPPYLYRSRTYTFTASGITKPEEGLIYTWSASEFAPGSGDSSSYICLTPDTPGSYSITVTVSSEDYYDISSTQTVMVIDSLFLGSLSGVIRGADSIVDTRDGHMYYTRTYGTLEWFVQNLDWAGAGHPYSKAEALSTPYGRLYSWNEATSGVANNSVQGGSATDLGEGPQGVCPPGWSVPTNEDWANLATVINQGAITFLDNWSGIADPLCAYAKLNDDYTWPYSPNNNKSNSAAWNGLPGGNSTNFGNNYNLIGRYGFWLSSSEFDANNGYYRFINYDANQFPYHYTDKNSFGASVRCVRLVVTEEEEIEEPDPDPDPVEELC